MTEEWFTPELEEKIKALKEKYAATGQDLNAYLEGLIYTDYLKYWDYVNLDALLNLQNPRTNIPDEMIFICYHQITELYFKLCVWAIRQVTDVEQVSVEEFIKQLNRVNVYFENLIRSFKIMVDGMEKEQFLKFRMALLPASGFQSAQYRIIEIMSTDAYNLVANHKKGEVSPDDDPVKLYEDFYFKQGGIELATGKRTLTLEMFEEKYKDRFLELISEYKAKNIWQRYIQLSKEDQQNKELLKAMRNYDFNIQVRWPLMHYKAADRYLHLEPEDIKATGGTNWQEYLPPKFQKVHLFPQILSDRDKKFWGLEQEEQ